jgi:transglutaminase-like putative cysteine protease
MQPELTRPLARILSLYALAAAVVALNWLRLEDPRATGVELVWILALALLPALVRGTPLRAAVAVPAAVLAAKSAFDVPLVDAWPWDRDGGFLSLVVSRFGTGFLNFYDVSLAFDGMAHPFMHGVVLAAIFTFCLVIGLGVATRRPLLAGVALVVGASWPATLISGGNELLRGAVILAGALLLIAGISARDGRVVGRSVVAAGAICLAALAVSTSPAVAKDEFFENWKEWDLYTRPDNPVSVRYVWDSNYTGIDFPKKRTVVFEVEAPPRSLYWRATTLDEFDGEGWVEDRARLFPDGQTAEAFDPLLPRRGRDPRNWIEQAVTVRALDDAHLLGASVPVNYRADPLVVGRIATATGGVAFASSLSRGDRYKVWSYAPRPTGEQLGRSLAIYPAQIELGGHLNVLPGLAAPSFGTPNRTAAMDRLFESYGAIDRRISAYRRLYEQARAVVGGASTPYAATVALEAWLRSGGGFTYDEQPPQSRALPPLVHFLLESKRGYCQQYAGAMALMLRYLGIPARVAAGFTSGRYDSKRGVWTVTDHEAHTWVEVWFDRYGWLPFDPTPARGRLSAPYTSASQQFRPSAVLQGLGALGAAALESANGSIADREALQSANARGGRDQPGDLPALVTRERGESLLRLLIIVGLLVAGAIVVAKQLVRRGRFLTRNPRKVAAACRRELVDFLVDQRIRVSPSATLPELAGVVSAELAVDAAEFVRVAGAARFAPLGQARVSAITARRELRGVERAIRRRLTMLERARGLLSLRSLGFAS